MLVSHTMRYCADVFGFIEEEEEPVEEPSTTPVQTGEDTVDVTSNITATFNKTALLISKKAWNCTGKSAVTGIVVSGIEPAGTKRRFMFKIDNKYWKISGTTLAEYTGTVDAAGVLKSGNTAAQLTAATNIPGFVGKNVYPIIALSAPSTAEDNPTAKLQLQTVTTTDTLTDTQESIVYELTSEDATPRIVEITSESTLIGDATATIQVRLRTGTTWSSYMNLPAAADQEADAVQFKITYKVTKTDGTDSAKVDSITVDHTMGKTVVSGEDADLYSVVADYDNDLKMCYVVVRHDTLIDSQIEAYVNFMAPPMTRPLTQIGTATGAWQELTLGVSGVKDNNIDASSIELFADGDPITDFSYNSETSTVVISVKKNKVIYATYKYNHGVEVWRKMTLDRTEPYNDDGGTMVSRFTYNLPDDETADMSTSNVRVKMKRPTGKVTNYSLGKATGKKQLFVLPHLPKVSTIKFAGTVDWSYNEDNNILTLTAAKNTALTVTYSWIGEPITVYSLAAGWSVA